ncbi:MAG: hypothetical protein L0027_02205 [Candidatus Rokubacteria bacterium]|nr:hypothetical protein [Candidatus Rokubacteria bacterium]
MDLLSRFDEVLTAHATKFRIMGDDVRQLGALLDEVRALEAGDLFLEGRYLSRWLSMVPESFKLRA